LNQARQFTIILQKTRDINVIVGRLIPGGTGLGFHRARKEKKREE
jgi:hypothetical protein